MHFDFDKFQAQALGRGFKEVLVRQWPADTVVEEHRHPFDADAMVVEGEMWLTAHAATRRLLPGDRFEIPAQEPHSERYGAQGATYWVARR